MNRGSESEIETQRKVYLTPLAHNIMDTESFMDNVDPLDYLFKNHGQFLCRTREIILPIDLEDVIRFDTND